MAIKGLTGIEEYRGKYRLRLPRSADTSIRYLNTGMEATKANRIKAQELATWIDRDILAGTLDRTLQRYRIAATTAELFLSINTQSTETAVPTTAPDKEKVLQITAPSATVVAPPHAVPNLLQIWQRFCQYRKPQVAETTYRNEYAGKYSSHIARLPSHDLSDAVVIRDYLINNLSIGQVKRVLTYLNACCNWGVKSGYLPVNPFKGMANDIRVRKGRYNIDPFSTKERDAIVHAFETHPRYAYYAPYVKCLFLTGARPGELAALRWSDITADLGTITFARSYNSQMKITKATKTGVVRKFPCNETVRTVLQEQRELCIRQHGSDIQDTLVFTSATGLPVHTTNFTGRVWKGCKDGKKQYQGIVTGLVQQGLVERYRCPYTCRHTYITMAIEAGVPVTQVAKWCGNSPEVILRHYAGTLAAMASPVV